nr:MAG TPA: hypothetical protein [Caudoviricetes sp.]
MEKVILYMVEKYLIDTLIINFQYLELLVLNLEIELKAKVLYVRLLTILQM